ncbi:hypothetical protein DM02DRAFT_63117 [Periconia macrospinosa]|uniref:Uncharacterized protein n=1 Tax=Periconia macrospinosa TaxID=97972 RepID=A0A2V1DIG6_9PLEO|nr:hypothetical protein DM02DRAFT_63117 [Periconia macrospinosa]
MDLPTMPRYNAGPDSFRSRSDLPSDNVERITKPPRKYPGERPQDRTLILMLSLTAMTTMTFLVASRFTHLKQRAISKRNITSVLILSLYVIVMAFFISMLVFHAGQGLYNYELCFALTWVCLVLYGMAKSLIYIFLVERIHVARAPFTASRARDYIYLGCMAFMMLACSGIVVNAFLHAYTAMDPNDGRCHNGINTRVTIPFLTVDIILDFVLTGVFVYLLHPFVGGQMGVGQDWRSRLSEIVTSSVWKGGKKVRVKSLASNSTSETATEMSTTGAGGRGNTAVQKSIKRLLLRTIVGAFAITIVTVGLFIVQLTVGDGGEGVALVCSSICLGDAFWGYLVIHYLTFCSLETEEDITRSTTIIEQQQHRQDGGGATTPPPLQPINV